MQRDTMNEILGEDHTLRSDEFATWQIAAMESGTVPTEVETAAIARLRFLAGAAIIDEILGDRLTTEAVTEAARQIHAVASTTAPLSLYWQDNVDDAVQPHGPRRRSHR